MTTHSLKTESQPASRFRKMVKVTGGSLLSRTLLAGCMVVMLAFGGLPARSQDGTNLVRNGGFEEGAAGWSLPQAFHVVDDVFHGGSRSLQLVNTNKASDLFVSSQAVPFKPGMQYRFSAWIRTRGLRGGKSGAWISVNWSDAKCWLGSDGVHGGNGDQDWSHVEGVTAPIPKEATSVRINLCLGKGVTGTVWFDDVSVTELYPPALDAALLRPNYRGRLLKNAANQRVIVRAKLADHFKNGLKPEQMTLAYSLRRDGKVLKEKKLTPQTGGYTDVTFDGRALPVGVHQVSVELLAPDKSRLGGQEFELQKLPAGAPQPAVFIDERNRAIVNGKPFFPLGWYFGPGPTSKDHQTHLDRVAASPFNTIMCYSVNAGGLDKVRAYLDDLAARNLKIIYEISNVYAGTEYFSEQVLGFLGEDAIVRGVVGAFKDHPALLAWYVNDERSLGMRDRLDARQRLVRQLDPQHPTWAVLNKEGQFYGYLNSTDVLGADPYPISHPNVTRRRHGVTLASDWTRECAAVSDSQRPLWMVPQAMDWACYHEEHAEKHRAPTLDEEMVMTYLCLINGAHGLIYYSYQDLMRDRLGFDKRWADMLVVGNEVKQLFPALLSAAKPPKLDVTTSSEAVQFAIRADDAGSRYVLMANPDGKAAATLRIGVPAKSKLRLLQRGKCKPLDSPRRGPCEIMLGPMSAATLVIKR